MFMPDSHCWFQSTETCPATFKEPCSLVCDKMTKGSLGRAALRLWRPQKWQAGDKQMSMWNGSEVNKGVKWLLLETTRKHCVLNEFR